MNGRIRFLLLGAMWIASGVACSNQDRGAGESSSATRAASEAREPVVEAMAKLHFPIVIDSACEGEDCEATNFPAVACDSAVLRVAASDSSTIVARIPVGDTVQVISRSLHLLQPGIVLVRRDYTLANYSGDGAPVPRRDTLHFSAGDTVYLLRYLELGVWTWSHKRLLLDGDEFWGSTIEMNLGGMSQDTTYAVLRAAPTIAHWWHVQPKRGATGWWHEEMGPALESVNQHLKWGNSCAVHAPSGHPRERSEAPPVGAKR